MSPSVDVAKFIKLYTTRREELIKDEKFMIEQNEGKVVDYYKGTLSLTMDITLEDIKNKSTDSYNLLQFISLLNSASITEDFINIFFGGDELRASKALSVLAEHSLISKKNGEDNYIMHEMIQQLVLDKCDKRVIAKNLDIAAKIIDDILPTEQELYSTIITEDKNILPNIDSLINHYKLHNVHTENLSRKAAIAA